MMDITVNDKEYEFIENETVSDLLQRLQFRFPLIIVRINGEFIPRKSYAETVVPKNATISVIHMISGG
jgi:sulfur carrier protein